MTPLPSASPDPARPRRTRTATPTGRDRRPYPTAPTLTRPSPARDGAGQPRTREAGELTPSTVWLCDTDPDTDRSGLVDVVTKIVTSFSTPGNQVGLLAWPASPTTVEYEPRSATAPKRAPVMTPALVPAMAAAVTAAGRLPVLLLPWSLPKDPAAVIAEPAGSRDGGVSTHPSPVWLGTDATSSHERPAASGGPAPLDLIITVVEPDAVDDTSAARTTLAAARALRRGGLLTLVTHCDRERGVLIDPGGLLVTAGQNADLLYLQHIVAVHAPVHDGHIRPTGPQPAGEDREIWPQVHCRVHSDLYVLAQQQDHHHRDPDPLRGVEASHGADR